MVMALDVPNVFSGFFLYFKALIITCCNQFFIRFRRLAKSRRSGRLGALRGLEIGFGGPLWPGRSREGLGETRDIGAM